MDECEGVFEGAEQHPTSRCEECGRYMRDHYWYAGLFERK